MTVQHLQHKVVKDLYWILFSEAPLKESYSLSSYALLPRSIIEQWKEESIDYFIKLDKNPASLAHFVNRKKNNRLGFYAEALLSYFFQTFSGIELLLQNYQVIEDKKTKGEIDFIIRYQGKVIHLECAVKFYLLKDNEHSSIPSSWVGPKIKDNLQLKLTKTIDHQLPLGKSGAISKKIGHSIDYSTFFLRGYLFADEVTSNSFINPEQLCEMIREGQLKENSAVPVQLLKKPDWLSSTLPGDKNKTIINVDSPSLVIFSDQKLRFIVPDNWGES